jgi:hypothetical protein
MSAGCGRADDASTGHVVGKHTNLGTPSNTFYNWCCFLQREVTWVLDDVIAVSGCCTCQNPPQSMQATCLQAFISCFLPVQLSSLDAGSSSSSSLLAVYLTKLPATFKTPEAPRCELNIAVCYVLSPAGLA